MSWFNERYEDGSEDSSNPTELSRKGQALSRLFDRQVKTLLTKRFPKLAGLEEYQFENLIEPFRNTAINDSMLSLTSRSKGKLPFLLVVPGFTVPWLWQLRKIQGFYHSHDFRWLTVHSYDGDQYFKHPYLVVGVEDGRSTIGTVADKAIAQIEHEDRFPLNLDEVLALALHAPWTLEHHPLVVGGVYCGFEARDGSGSVVTLISKSHQGRVGCPEVEDRWTKDSAWHLGMPSGKLRIHQEQIRYNLNYRKTRPADEEADPLTASENETV